jgi:YVTN family beta-propeller protein
MKLFVKQMLVLSLAMGNVFAQAGDYLSPAHILYSPSEACLYVAQSTARRVDVVEPETRKIVQSIAVAGRPSGIALSKDAQRLYVSTVPEGIVFYDRKQEKITATVAAGYWPNGPVLSPNEDTLYLCNRFDNSVSVIDTARAVAIATIEVVREPVAAALSPDGKLLFVANHLPAGAADTGYSAAQVSVIDTDTRKQIKLIDLPNGSTGMRGICISPDGQYVYTTHILARYQLPTTQLDRGWMNTNAVSIIDVATQSRYTTFLLDDVDHGAANPWAIACSPDGAHLFVTHAGTHELSVIDRVGLHRKLEALAAGKAVSNVIDSFNDVPRDLSFLGDLRQRIPLDGQGPRSLAVTQKHVFIGQYFSDSIAVMDLSAVGRSPQGAIPLNPDFQMTPVRQGEIFFNDASLCFQKWQSCASCHPDGRADALNWDLLNDGIGNPKNTKSLLLSHQTPPVMVTGIRDRAETAVRTGIRYIQFSQQPEENAAAIDAYLKSMEPVPSPYLKNGELSRSAGRGKRVYEAAGCGTCHSGPAFTNLQKYDVGTGMDRDRNTAFDTPALAEIWRTAPYLYKGQAATMRDVLTKNNPDDRHGKVSALSDEELHDLIEYILSL